MDTSQVEPQWELPLVYSVITEGECPDPRLQMTHSYWEGTLFQEQFGIWPSLILTSSKKRDEKKKKKKGGEQGEEGRNKTIDSFRRFRGFLELN